MRLPWRKPTPEKRDISVWEIKDLDKYLERHFVSKYELRNCEWSKDKETWKKDMRRSWIMMIVGLVLLFWLEILTIAVFASHH